MGKILKCWDGRYSSCILSDEMGLGKTIQAILACISDADTTACFDLIVTTKTCVKQWAAEIEMHFEEVLPLIILTALKLTLLKEHRPTFFVLDSSHRKTAKQLIDGRYDFVIVSYGYLRAQFQRLQAYEKFHRDVHELGQGQAEQDTRSRAQKRPDAPLLSSLYRQLDLPIGHLVLDEEQYVKNPNSLGHQAIKGLFYKKLLIVTGTPMPNRWFDIYGCIDFMMNHPFPRYSDFLRCFSDLEMNRAGPPPSKLPRLIKFLMEVTVSRPASLLKLPGLETLSKPLDLTEKDFDCVVLYTKLFLDALKAGGHATRDATFRTSTKATKALIFATRAQQFAAHPELVEAGIPTKHQRKLSEISRYRNTAGFASAKELITSMLEELAPTQQAPEDDDDDEEDQEYAPNKGFIEDADSGQDDESDDDHEIRNRKTWLAKVKRLDINTLVSRRMASIRQIIDSIWSKDSEERIVIFSKFVKFLDLVDEMLKRLLHITPMRLDGLSTRDQRAATTDQFAAAKSSVLLITPKTGGAGLNGLESASHCIQCEPWWTTTEQAQAYARLFRPRQGKVVQVHYLEARNSAIDLVIERVRDSKNRTNEEIMGPLRRRDDEPPQIPRILEWHYYGM